MSRDSLYPVLAGLVALAAFLPGIDWGLPDRNDDRFLFGERQPWTGAQIIELAGGLDGASGRGADVDANPVSPDAGPVVLNDTDQKRAEIVRRYRLFSHQPDEFINFAAIAGMAQRRDGDPRLYQYGGLWIYPVAGLLGAAEVVGYVQLTGDLAFYLDRPEEFGKFYVVARLFSTMWGAIGAGVVFVIVRRLTGSGFTSICAAISFSLLPVIVTAAHEAKPHLAGAVLVMWAVLKADDYVRTGRRRDAVWAGVLSGAASAMVVSMIVSFVLLAVMGHLRWRRGHVQAKNGQAEAQPDRIPGSPGPAIDETRAQAGRATLSAIVLGFLVYAVSNPYVIYHAFFDRAVFQSNIGNSTAMYQARDLLGGVAHGTALLVIAAGTLFSIALVTALLVFVAQRSRLGARAWLLITAAGAVLIYFLPLGAGKPPEYARFGIVPMTVLLVAYFAVVGRGLFPLPRQRLWLAVLGIILTAISGVPYIANFHDDSGPVDTRRRAAARLVQFADQHSLRTLRLSREPAPWSVPPFDLWEFTAVLAEDGDPVPLPVLRVQVIEAGGSDVSPMALVRGRYSTPISWANKTVLVQVQPS